MKKKKRVIALVDCNNFFVSCEVLLKPELKGKPVCVLSNNDGCVVSRSMEAKKLGLEMGTPYFIAKNQFKKVIFLSGNLSFYREISKRVMKKLYDFSPDVEICSIDEAFLDLTGLNNVFNLEYEEITKKIVEDIKTEIGIDVSVGLSYSKVLAKLANDKAKTLQKSLPDKKTYTIGYKKIEEELKGTLVSDVWGVGRNITALLKKYLIKTAYDFVLQNDTWIKKHLGKKGLDLKQELMGNIINLVIPIHQEPKSISRSESFKEFQTDKRYIQEQLNSHIHKVCKKLREENLLTSCIQIFLRTKDFQTSNMKINLTYPVDTEFGLIEYSMEILNKLFKQGTIYRSVGFCATKLSSKTTQQISIFDGEKILKQQKLTSAWDKLEEKFGKNIVKLGLEKKSNF